MPQSKHYLGIDMSKQEEQGVYRLERQQWINRPREEVFAFFSEAANLHDVTPPWLGFRIFTPLPIEIREGAIIDYRIRLAGIPIRWRTVITEWNPPQSFVDMQDKGPYALWEHTHRFDEQDGGTLMTDLVRYALRFGVLGRLAHRLAVRGAVSAIFDHRYDVIRNVFARSTDAQRPRLRRPRPPSQHPGARSRPSRP